MKNIYLVLCSLVIFLQTHASDDPYADIEYIKLDNGLEVFLAPSAKATTAAVKLNVKVGTITEDKSNWGVSHLLEHMLFRDNGLKDEMTYLQLIKEAGGSANGTTGYRETQYFGSIPPEKSTWLFETIGKMILHPTLSDEFLAKEKGTVELEIGRPGPITLTLGFNPREYLFPSYISKPSFWESEFNIDYEKTYTISEEQLSNRKLTLEKVKKHYEDYYYPRNMQLFVSGNFNRKEILNHLHNTWAKLPDKPGKVIKPLPQPKLREAPYYSQQINDSSTTVYLGTKLWQTSLTEEEVLDSYMEYLTHRLMKEIRNLKGQTYSANASTYVTRGYGYSYLSFETPRENLAENLSYAQNYLKNEAEAGALAPEKVKEAVDLYLAKYKLSGRESSNMMSYARQYADILEEHGKFTSPYAALASITPAEYNAALKKHFVPKMKYELTYRPSLFFQYDYALLWAAIAVISFVGFRRWLTKPFAHDHVRWIRKVKYPPIKALEILTLFVGYLALMHISFAVDLIFRLSTLLQSNIFTSYYLNGVAEIFCTIVAGQGLLSIIPRKLMVIDRNLLVKSISYYSHEIPLSEIASVETVRAWSFPFRAKNWTSPLKVRFYFLDPCFWRKGLLINLKDGRNYFFSVTSAEKAKHELTGLIKKEKYEATNEWLAA